ncbi:MAG: AAA family ATPase [Actinobacteria bacterium]|nr:AAA family ATPase [Actinomycetota bacterium]
MNNLTTLRGRDSELASLLEGIESARSAKPQLVVVSGPRRVGKTFLLRHLLDRAKGFTTVYFEATEAGERDQLRRFTQELATALPKDSLLPETPFVSWEHAINTCEFIARSSPLAVVIDEATYLMTSTPGFTSIVQAAWDRLSVRAGGAQLFLVLSGSAVGLIEDALSYSGALYQRPTRSLRMSPFNAAEGFAFVGSPDPVAFIEAYAACGGYPLHLDAWEFDESTDQNLLRLAGSAGGLLLEDANLLLTSLPEVHRRVLITVGQGRAKLSEITNELRTRVNRPLESLTKSRLLTASTPLGAPMKARPFYRVTDPYLRFWIRVLSDHLQRIEAGQGENVLQSKAGEWQGQLGTVFEQAAREHALRLVATGVVDREAVVDEWWSTSGEQCQVDVLGIANGRTVLLGEARWTAQPLGRSAVNELGRSLRYVPDPIPDPWLVLWGRGGVRPEVTVGKILGYGPHEMLAT